MIPHNRPTLGAEEEEAASRVVRSGWVAQGSEVEHFEDEFCRFLGLPPGHAVALSSGTAALYLALTALDARGKQVAFPAHVCSAVRNAVALAGARETLLDSSRETPNLDPSDAAGLDAEIAIAPYQYGLPFSIPKTLDLQWIEDCAQSLGARVGGAPAGLQGRIGVYSFYATKLITSGGYGGMLVSREADLVDKARDFRQFDGRRDQKRRFNFQMSDLAAALGRTQLQRLPGFLERRSQIFETYREAGLELLDCPASSNGDRLEPVRYRAVIRPPDPAALISRLEAAGIEAIVPTQEWELQGDPAQFPRARHWTRTTLSLPCYPTLSDRDLGRIIEACRS